MTTKTITEIFNELKTKLSNLDTIYDGIYQTPEAIYALRKTIKTFNITIEDWNTLLNYVNDCRSAFDGLFKLYPDLLASLEEILDDMHQDIEDEIDDLSDSLTTGTLTVKKAEQDGLGRNIAETYETKSDAQAKLQTAESYTDSFAKDLTFYNYKLTLTNGLDNTITEIVLPFDNFYTKTETQGYVTDYAYSKNDIDRIVSTIKADELQVVSALPQTGEEGIIYLVPISSDPSDGYYRYIWENDSWLNLGTTEIDLSNKLDKLTTTGHWVYAHHGSAQTELEVFSVVYPNAVVQRDLEGGIIVPNTIADNTEAINANYANSNYVKRTLTIAGINLQNNISAQDLTDALVFMNTTTDIDYVMGD